MPKYEVKFKGTAVFDALSAEDAERQLYEEFPVLLANSLHIDETNPLLIDQEPPQDEKKHIEEEVEA